MRVVLLAVRGPRKLGSIVKSGKEMAVAFACDDGNLFLAGALVARGSAGVLKVFIREDETMPSGNAQAYCWTL